MRYIYLKKDNKYLHIVQNEHESFEDYSDVSGMYTQHFVLKTEKEGAIKFLQQHEVDYFLVKAGRRLKGFKQVKE